MFPTRWARAATLAVFLAASWADGAALPADAAQTQMFVFATDFSTGTLARVPLDPPRTPATNLAGVCADAVLRWHQGLLYVVERFGCDNLRVVDPANGYMTIRQFSLGNGSNPQDAAILSPDKAYVPRYDRDELWIVNPESGTFLGAISLAGVADADGVPEMHRAAIAQGRVFVTVQRLDRDGGFVPTDSSQVVVVDTAADTLLDCDPEAPGIQGILLPFQNPNTELVVDARGRLLVGCTGAFGVLDGGVVRVDPVRLEVEAVEVTEGALGGDLGDVVPFTDARGFAVVTGSFPASPTSLVAYDRLSGATTGTIFSTPGFALSDAEVDDRGALWIGDRTFAAPGLRVFDAATGAQQTSQPIPTGLPPQDLQLDDTWLVAVPAPAAPGAHGARDLALIGVGPNPTRGSVSVRFRVAGPGVATAIGLYDAAGRRLAGWSVPTPDAGEYAVVWDGRDGAGRAVPPGIYLVRLARGAGQAQGRLVRLP